jgi:hypothetical protein
MLQVCTACATNSYRRSGILGGVEVGVYATAITFLTPRGYKALPQPTIGPVAVLERVENGRLDRLSVFEQYRTFGQGSPSPLGETPTWSTVKVVAETYELAGAGKPRRVPASPLARAHADSLLVLLTSAPTATPQSPPNPRLKLAGPVRSLRKRSLLAW